MDETTVDLTVQKMVDCWVEYSDCMLVVMKVDYWVVLMVVGLVAMTDDHLVDQKELT
jgi:hypothetical protein